MVRYATTKQTYSKEETYESIVTNFAFACSVVVSFNPYIGVFRKNIKAHEISGYNE